MGLRERKRARTAEQIQDAALGLFRTKGYRDTTVEDIADAVDISRATVFRYFPAKEDILFACEPADLERLTVIATSHSTAGSFDAAVRITVREFVEELLQDGAGFWLRWDIVQEDPRLLGRALTNNAARAAQLVQVLGRGDEFRERVVASAALTSLYQAIRYSRPPHDDLLAQIDEAFDALGIGC